MPDDPKENGSDGGDLDDTISRLESLLDNKNDQLRDRGAGRGAPTGVRIPRLTKKVIDVSSVKFDADPATAAPEPPDDDLPTKPVDAAEGLLEDVKQIVGENMQRAFADLKADVTDEDEAAATAMACLEWKSVV